jgi:hypothetical protein
MGITFDEFKDYFEFALEVSGVVGGIGAVIYKVDSLNAIWKVAQGRANSADESVALKALEEGGAVAQQVVRGVAKAVDRRGHKKTAKRLNELQGQAQASRSASPGQASRSASPGQMV